MLDLGADDRVVGIEILDASKRLRLEQLLPVTSKNSTADYVVLLQAVADHATGGLYGIRFRLPTAWVYTDQKPGVQNGNSGSTGMTQ